MVGDIKIKALSGARPRLIGAMARTFGAIQRGNGELSASVNGDAEPRADFTAQGDLPAMGGIP